MSPVRQEDADAEHLCSMTRMTADSLEKDLQYRRDAKTADVQRRIGTIARMVDSCRFSLSSRFLRHVQLDLYTPLHGTLCAGGYLRAAINVDEADCDTPKLELSANSVLATLLEFISLSGLVLKIYLDDLPSFQRLPGTDQGDARTLRPTCPKLVKSVEPLSTTSPSFHSVSNSGRLLSDFPARKTSSCKPELTILASPELRNYD